MEKLADYVEYENCTLPVGLRGPNKKDPETGKQKGYSVLHHKWRSGTKTHMEKARDKIITERKKAKAARKKAKEEREKEREAKKGLGLTCRIKVLEKSAF